MASKAGGGEGKDGEDYYATLGLELGATTTQISKAYKKLALKLHPDRNPNDSLAGQRFHALQQAYDVLSDPEARAAFDALIQARLNRKRKLSTMDAQRRNLKQTLEERENAFKRQRADELDAQRRLAARMARLKEETAAKMQQEKLRRQQTQDRVAAPSSSSSSTSSSDEEVVVKLRWGKKEGWDDEAGVRSALERAGCPAPLAVAVRRRGGGAMATFASLADADAALARLPPPLTGRVRRSRASTPPASSSSYAPRAAQAAPSAFASASTPASAAAGGSTPSAAAGLGHADFESQVLARMAMAAAAMRQQQQQQQQQSTAPPPVQQNSE